MIAQSILEDTKIFLEHLGLGEEPFGVYYDDIRPEKAFGPKTGVPISRELEDQGQLNMQEVFKQFSCVMGNIWLARKKHRAAYISSEEYGCPGGVFYCTQIDGLPLGVESGTRYKGKEFVLSPGEALLFFSDGVTEAVNEKNELFGDDRLTAYFEMAHGPPWAEGLLNRIDSWRGKAAMNDDLTLLEIWRAPSR